MACWDAHVVSAVLGVWRFCGGWELCEGVGKARLRQVEVGVHKECELLQLGHRWSGMHAFDWIAVVHCLRGGARSKVQCKRLPPDMKHPVRPSSFLGAYVLDMGQV